MLHAAMFAINSGLNFVLGLLVARFLGPEQFGLYALGAALMVLINAFAIDWLKLSTMRFYSQDKRANQPSVRATLDGMAALCTLSLIAILFAAILSGMDLRIPTAIAAAAVAAGLTGGLFEYQQAVARVRAEDKAYARMVIIKNALALVLMVGGAWIMQDPAIVLLGSALSSLAALVVVRRALADAPLVVKDIDPAQLRIFVAYALPLVVSNVLLSTIPLLNRSVMASSSGLAEAGYFALASDIGLKLLGTVGATLEILLLPIAVRAFERGGVEAAHAQVGKNLVLILAVMLPIAAGLLLVMPAFEALLVPQAFRGHFGLYVWILMPAFLALPLMQAGFNAVNLIANRTFISIISASLAVVVNGLLIVLALYGLKGGVPDPGLIAGAMSAGFAASCMLVAAGSLRHAAVRPPFRDLAGITLGLIVMIAALWPLREMQPAALALALQVVLGMIAYGGVLLACNTGGCRPLLTSYLKRRRVKVAS